MNATADWNEPWSPVSGGVSVWYLWTAPRNGSVTFTATPGSSFTPAVTVYIGDAPDHTVLLGSGLVSATFQATQNETYRIAVDGQNGGTGPFDLSWGSAPTGAAANDYFADAQTIDGASGSVSGSTANATVEYGEPVHSGLSCCENPNGHSIWYRWTAPASGDLFLSTEGSSFNTVVAVYAGSSLSGLVRLGGSNDVNPWATWSRAWIRISAGQTYLIAVDAPAGQSGGVQLAWRTTASTGELTAPSVQLLTPPPGANVNGVISFTADAADDQGVDRVEYSISPAGSGFPWYIGEAYAAPYQVAFDTSVLSPGSYSVWATAYDASGNQMSAGASITVGTIPPPPTLTVPAPITKEATSARGAVVKFSATAWDSNGAPLAVTCKPASGSTFPLGTTKVSCSAVDSYGSRTTKTFTIEVVDTTPPVVTVPSALAADATGPKGAWISYTAAAADTVSGTLVPSCKPASGDTYPIGDTTVSCAATDAAGNTGSASFVVHVRGAHEQLENTRTWLAAQGVDQALAAKLDGELADVEKQIDDDKSNAACGGLADLATDASKQAGKKLTADQAGRLTADAARVGAVIGC